MINKNINLCKKFFSSKAGYNFLNFEIPIEANTVLSDLTPYFDKFIKDNKNNLGEYISVICQVREVGNIYYTIGERFPINIDNPKDLTDYVDYIQSKWNILDNNQYNPNLALSIIFNYTNTTDNNYSLSSNKFRITKNMVKIELNKEEIPLGLPMNTYYSTWGNSSEMLADGTLRVKELFNDLNKYIEVINLNKTDTQINLFSSESNIKITTFVDRIININEFVRTVGNKVYYFIDNKLYFIFDKLICDKFITRVKPSKGFVFNAMTLDVETYKDENKDLNIYCISLYDGVKAYSFYLTDFNDVHQLINKVLKTIFTKKYAGKHIYIHNSSEFDMIFLYSYIINYFGNTVKPIIKDGKFINLEVEYGNATRYKVYFKDSLLLLPYSLDKLSKTFNEKHIKDMFPHDFVNKDNLNFVGIVPDIKFFKNITESQYKEYKSKFDNNWSLKCEAIKYCELDCKSLFEAISKFAEKTFNLFKVNTSTTPTLPSVAMKTYRTSSIPEGIKIAKIGGKMFDHIHNAFYGGHVDMYIPTNPIGTKVYGYDVNSLYPHVMKYFKYPYQFIAHFYGDISNMKQYFDLYHKCVGFYKVNLTTPTNILHPILPKKVNNTTVYGIGSWTDWYYSEELKNAAKLGYTFEILEGYLFKTADLFSNYIDTMYHMKETSEKDTPNYLIPKMLQNSLFGKFSMKRELINYSVIDKYRVDNFIDSIGFDNFINHVDIGNQSLVSYRLQYQNELNINIAIGAAVTANARIYMSQFFNDPNLIVYYTDTDSAFVNKPLPDHLVDPKRLGAFKLEHVLDKFVALGPKVYGGIDTNGIEFTKIKGLKSKLTFNQLEYLLNENVSLDIKQEKWFNHLVDSTINVKDDTSYNLKVTNNKRNLIYEKGKLVGTSNKDVSDN